LFRLPLMLPRVAGSSRWAAFGLAAGLGLALFAFVDLTPAIEADFFFSSDDPQLQGSRRIEREFGLAPQVFVAARSPQIVSRAYLRELHDLTEDLRRIDGVADARSVTRGASDPADVFEDEAAEVFEDLDARPFWRRLLLAPDRSATFVVLRLDGRNDSATIDAIDRILLRHAHLGFELGATGVPYVSEHIRDRLGNDLQRFSVAAFVAFAVLIGWLFRSLAILIGTMVAALSACFGTFLVRPLLGMRGDILMPNLWTIAFVLTLSHIVYLAAEWQRRARDTDARSAVRDAIRHAGPASLWSLAANLLGFGSLLFVSAQPLRHFGMSGAIAAVLGIGCAYGLFPPFLRAARPPPAPTGATVRRTNAFFRKRHPRVAALALLLAVALAPFAWQVETDPTLPSYFGRRDPIRTGLEAIDRAGGSSPLDVVVADVGGRAFDDGELVDRLQGLQARLERHPDVGAVLSIASLMGETERPWYAFLFSWETRLDQLDRPKHDRVGRTFLSDDRRRGRFILRMRESARSKPRTEIIEEIAAIVRAHGFRPDVVGGLYPLQGELSDLVEGSLIRGLGGLLVAFFLIVWVVTRTWRTAVAMAVCLAMTPLMLFGAVGLLGTPLDIIAAPAANVALPLGIDEMIHLGHAVRRGRPGGRNDWTAWQRAIGELWRPIVFSMAVVASGFALFLLSSFPPTQRLGLLVCAGAILTDVVVLTVLPTLATRGGADARHAVVARSRSGRVIARGGAAGGPG
jgi:predicted RND superfamily exporter protein